MAPHRLPAITVSGMASEVPPPDFWSRPIANFQVWEHAMNGAQSRFFPSKSIFVVCVFECMFLLFYESRVLFSPDIRPSI